MFNKIKSHNFVNRFIENRFDIEEFKQVNKNLTKYQLANIVKQSFDIDIINKKYLDILENSEIYKFDQVIKMYNDLKHLTKEQLEEEFCESYLVYNILKNNLINVVTDTSIIDIFRYNDEIENLKLSLQSDINILNGQIAKIDDIGLREVTKRTFRNIVKKIKKI